MFDECNTVEKMVLETLAPRWTYIPADKLNRQYSDVMVESRVGAALMKLNPEIASLPERADDDQAAADIEDAEQQQQAQARHHCQFAAYLHATCSVQTTRWPA